MTITTNKIQLPFLEDTGLDRRKLYTPKEWTERLRHYIERIYNIDIKPELSGKQYRQTLDGQNKTRNKTSSGELDHQQSKT